MKKIDYLWLGILTLGAAFIWGRDLAWTSSASETLPVLAALPLFIAVGGPWKWRENREGLSGRLLAVAGGLTGLGVLLDVVLLLAAGWTVAMWAWLRANVVSVRPGLRQLMLLPLMAFPWLVLDFAGLGWWFRMSAAWAADHVFKAMGFAVLRHGTQLTVHGLPIEIAAACSGTNTLQAVLLAGIVLFWLEFRGRPAFWLALMALPVFAWSVNLVRINVIVASALTWGAEFAAGWFHGFAGWLVLVVCFVAGRFMLATIRRPFRRGGAAMGMTSRPQLLPTTVCG